MIRESRRIAALLLLFVTITGVVMAFGENVLCAGELPGAHEKSHSSPPHDTEPIQDSTCPYAPSPDHSPSDHFCTGDCGCPCQAPLSSSALTFSHSVSFTYQYHAELTRYIPEVYLSLFVPPDSVSA
ncbi:MAG: hypothetical protein IPQ16_06405 [Geobacteraceae bacterium]|nr:hypothetical protein [Geobacteraceae bacterium]